jgi:cell division protein FtsZ
VILPFECEGTRRHKQAQAGFQELKAAADAVICLPNQKVFRFIDENTSVVDAFAITNEFVGQAIRAIYRLLTRPGLINVDFGDLAAITRGKHSETSLATAEASGESRAREVVEKLLRHPLLETTQPLAEASAVLVSIAGGLDLTMGEVNRIMEQVNRHCEQAHIILGAAIDDNLAGRISVTLLASATGAAPVSELSPTQPLAREAAEPGSPLAGQPGTRPLIVPGPPHESAMEPAAPATPNANGRVKRAVSRMRQGQLPLEIVSKGRFEKSEPTIFHGQDLDVPTYIRRGIALN